MATYIAPAPVVKGTAAAKNYKETNQKAGQALKKDMQAEKTDEITESSLFINLR